MQAIALTPKSTAALIRQILRRAFPATRFSVTTGRGSGVSSVDIRWTDGPTTKLVDALTQCFESGSFDGMTDSYTYNEGAGRYLVVNGQTYRRGCRYVFTERTISPALANRCITQLVEYWGGVTEAPVATQSAYGAGYVLPDGVGHQKVRADLPFDWHDMIHQAAGDRTRFTRTPIASD